MVELLTQEVESRFGRKISCQKDCISLSISIMDTCREYLSPATLRRLFGLLATNSNPSHVTLDILSRYAGYTGWDDFVSHKKSKIPEGIIRSADEDWEQAAEHAKAVSSKTLNHIMHLSGIRFEETVHRRQVEERLDQFLNSNNPATAIIAPGGYGKSILLAHWYQIHRDLKANMNDVFLLAPATMLDHYASSNTFIGHWLAQLLGQKSLESLLVKDLPGRIVFIFDALDEVVSVGARFNKILEALADLAEAFAQTNRFKLVISTRLSTWTQLKPYITHPLLWYFSDSELLTHEGANIPPLSPDEVQQILDQTINLRFNQRLLIFELHPDLRQTLSYPYFLQLFIQVYTPEKQNLLNNQHEILLEFLKSKIYFSTLPDEKVDILTEIIRLGNGHRVLKEDIKRSYPIHLKLSGNYFTAYHELLSYGIITEEQVVESTGRYFKYVRITSPQLTGLLIVQDIVNSTGGITEETFRQVEEKFAGTELYPLVQGTLYYTGSRDRNEKVLVKFFELCPNAYTHGQLLREICATLRNSSYLLNVLMPEYTKTRLGRQLLVEQNIDLNHLNGYFTTVLKHYLSNTTDISELFFAQTLLAFNGFITLNGMLAQPNHEATRNVKPPADVSPLVAGAWFSNQLFAEIIMGNGNNTTPIVERATSYYRKFTSYAERAEFSELIVPTLLLLGQHPAVENYLEDISSIAGSHYQVVNYFNRKLFEILSGKNHFSAEEDCQIQQIYQQLNPIRSFPQVIAGEVGRAASYFHTQNLTMAHQCIRNAIELSGIAGYKLVEMKLMNGLARVLSEMREEKQAMLCREYAETLWKCSGFTSPNGIG